jgi:hypothetical protein
MRTAGVAAATAAAAAVRTCCSCCCSSRAHTRHVAHARANGTHSAAHGAPAPRRDVGSNQLATHVVGSNQRPHGRVSAGCTRLPHLTAAAAAGLLPLLSLAVALPPLAPAARSRATAIVAGVHLRSNHAAAHHRTTARLYHRAHGARNTCFARAAVHSKHVFAVHNNQLESQGETLRPKGPQHPFPGNTCIPCTAGVFHNTRAKTSRACSSSTHARVLSSMLPHQRLLQGPARPG